MLLYVAGPYSGPRGVQAKNIENARNIALELWGMGHYVICPHTNTAYFELGCKATYEQYIAGDLLILSKCDGIVFTPDWRDSNGATLEMDKAVELGLLIYHWPDSRPVLEYEGKYPAYTIPADQLNHNSTQHDQQKVADTCQVGYNPPKPPSKDAPKSPSDSQGVCFKNDGVIWTSNDGPWWDCVVSDVPNDAVTSEGDESVVVTHPGGGRESRVTGRYDQLPELGLYRVAVAAELGVARYGEDNWRRGIPLRSHINHAISHLYKYLEGDVSEDHLGHAAWRALAAAHVDETGLRL